MNQPVITKKPSIQINFVPIVVNYNGELRQIRMLNEKTIQETIAETIKQYEAIKDQDPTKYAFKLKITNQYINERNRSELLAINDQVRYHEVALCLNLETDVRILCDHLMNTRITQADNLIKHLIELEKNLTNDKNYAFEFYAQKGKKLLFGYLEAWKESNDPKQWNVLYSIYKNLTLLIQKRGITWDSVDIEFLIIKLVLDTLNSSSKDTKQDLISNQLVLLFLNIVNEIINNSQQMRKYCLTDLKYSEIIFLIKRDNLKLKESLLTLFNDSFKIGDQGLKVKLYDIMSQHSVKTLFKEMIRDPRIDSQTLKQLAILQKNTLNIKCGQLKKEFQDESHLNGILQTICDNAFQMSVNDKIFTYEEKYARLGFNNCERPLEDFDNSSSSLLALKFMHYFSDISTFKSILQTFIVDKSSKSSDYIFPFAKASIALVKTLYDLLEMETENPPNEKFELIYIMFSQNEGLNDFISKCLCLFNKLWCEMKAQILDFDKALLVCKESLLRILNDKNKLETDCPNKIREFLVAMDTWKYDNNKTTNLAEKMNKEPVKQLKQILTNEVIEMVKPKRIHLLCKGERFEMKVISRDRDKKTKQERQSFWALSSDHREFTYKDLSENGDSNETGKVLLENIKKVEKEDARRSNSIIILCDTVDGQNEESFILSNQNDEIIELWLDAINMIKNPRPTPNIACFVECLMDTQLLDIHTLGINIPQEIPPIPPLPDSFDFVTQLNC